MSFPLYSPVCHHLSETVPHIRMKVTPELVDQIAA